MPRRIVAIACVAAGTLYLAGPGWALLVLGVLVEVGWPRQRRDWRLTTVGARLWDVGVHVAAKVRAMPQQITAAVGTGSGLVLIPLGVGVFAGWGLAVLVLGILTLVLGLLLDRTA